MMTFDIAVATFLLAGVGFILKIFSDMKKDLKESLKEQHQIISKLELLTYRLEQVEYSCNFASHAKG